jgi:hypothetical protein
MVLFFPLNSDLSIYQWVALRLLHDGAPPILGAWIHNFPGVIVFHAIAILLFGNNDIGFRIVEALFQISVSLLMFQLLLRWFEPRAAFFAVLFYIGVSTKAGIDYMGEPDVFAAGLIVVAIFYLIRSQYDRSSGFIVSALVLGVVVLIRPLYAVLPVGIAIVYYKEWGIRKAMSYVFLGALPVVGFVVLYAIFGYFPLLYESIVLFNISLYSQIGPTFREVYGHARGYWPEFIICIVALIPFRSDITRNVDGSIRKLYVTLLLLALFILIIQRKFLEYHYAPVLTLLSPIGGLGLTRLVQLFSLQKFSATSALVVTLLFFAARTPIVMITRLVRTIPQAYDPFLRKGPIGRPYEDAVVNFLEKEHRDTGLVEIASYDARLRMIVERSPATRYPMLQALVLKDSKGSHPPFQSRWRADYFRDIATIRPRFYILNAATGFWDIPPLGVSLSHDFPQLDTILRTEYQVDTMIGGFRIYERKS